MTPKLFLWMLGCLLSAGTLKAQTFLSPSTPLYQHRDLTAEHLFSVNIEGPAFRHDTLFVVNYLHDGTIGYVLPGGRCGLYLQLPQGSTGNSLKFDARGWMYVADFTGHNVLLVSPSKQVSAFCHEPRFSQPNDICMAPQGRIYASDPDWKDSTGAVWLVTRGHARLLEHMGTANGIELSPDNRTLYVNESDQRKIWSFRVAPDGSLSHKTLFASFPDFGLDGMHCDKDGHLYVCRYGKGQLDEFSPAGRLLRRIPLKGRNCSNFVFGDRDGRTVFVTLQDRKCVEMFRVAIPGKGY